MFGAQLTLVSNHEPSYGRVPSSLNSTSWTRRTVTGRSASDGVVSTSKSTSTQKQSPPEVLPPVAGLHCASLDTKKRKPSVY